MPFSQIELNRLLESLRPRIAGEVFADYYHRALYGSDASLYQIQPLAVVVPRTQEDARAAVQFAVEHGLSIIPRGSGTSLSGQAIGAGMVLDFSKHLNRIVELDASSQTARVEPGVVLDQLNAAAARHGLQFGPDVATSSRANLGGMIGNNSSGSRSIKNGKTVDHVVELSVLLSDGSSARLGFRHPDDLHAAVRGGFEHSIAKEVERIVAENRDQVLLSFPRVLRRVSGYNLDEFISECRAWYPPPPNVRLVRQRDAERFPGASFNLAKLIVGAEGTLATVTEALVHLVPLPPHRAVVVLHFDSLDAACDALGDVLALEPSAAEFFDKLIVNLARANIEYSKKLDFVVGDPESLILVEFEGETATEVEQRVRQLTAAVQGRPGLFHVLPAVEPQLREHVWACRKAALPLLMSIPGTRKPVAFVEDTAVDPSRLPEFVRKFREIIRRNGTEGAFYGHASVGCLHIRPLLDAGNKQDLERLVRISSQVCDLVIEFGGAMSGEHGDGLARSYLNERLFGDKLYQAFRQVKAAFDPHNRMNPGKIVDAPGPIENLRQGADYKPLIVTTALDFSNQGGFAQAVELCNGSGVCRKTATGTMCPSFMATGDEEHSTRGRANALRLVLSSVLPPEELSGEKLYQTFDLCLQCKGCKAECPSNVDVARMKVEFLHRYYREHGVPRGVRMMGNVAKLNRRGAAFAPFSNWVMKLPGGGWLREKLLGIDRRRPLPKFHRRHFRKWFRAHERGQAAQQDGGGSRGEIVLLDDCLTSYCEPHVNQAAVEVLKAVGYQVRLAGLECCGRAMISKGLVEEAKKLAAENVRRLLPWVERGVPIVGCEPSCILTLVDDYLDLRLGDAARQVAAACQVIDTHLVRAGIDWNDLFPRAREARIVLHGHCHQKALVGAGATVELLKRTAAGDVQLLDSGCCGMAGSFGYEHYDLSMRIGERVLFPAVRAAETATIIAPGFSCRQQIEQGTGRRAEHPLEFIARHLR